MRTLFLVAALLLLGLLPPGRLRAQPYALVVGHGSAEHVARAAAVAARLSETTPQARVTLLIGAEATAPSIRSALYALLREAPSQVFVYLSAPVHVARLPDGTDAGWLLVEGSALPTPADLRPERALALQPFVREMGGLGASHIVVGIEAPAAALAAPVSPVLADTFVAVVAGAADGALARAFAHAPGYREAIAHLLTDGPGLRLSLQPARAAQRQSYPSTRSARLVLPPLPPGTAVVVDGQAVEGPEVALGPGDHLVGAFLNGSDLWRGGIVLALGEVRRLTRPSDLTTPVFLTRSQALSDAVLRVNGLPLPVRDTVALAPGRLAVSAERRGQRLSASGHFSAGSVVEAGYHRPFSTFVATQGLLVPGMVQARQGARFKGAVLLASAVASSGLLGLYTAQYDTAQRDYAAAQRAYTAAEGEAAVRDARSALATTHARAQAVHRRFRLARLGVGLTWTLNAGDVLVFHARPQRLRLVLAPLPR